MTCVFLSTSKVYAQDLNSGLVCYWKFDEGSGSTASDSSGNGNNGVIYNAAWVDGIYGKALYFNGIDSYVEVPSSSVLNNANFTIMAWINMSAYVGNTQVRIVSKQATQPNSYGLEIFGNGYAGSTGNQLTTHSGDGSVWVNLMSDTRLSIKTWYHVAATHEGTTSRLYINGTLDKEGTTTTQTTDNAAPLTIGCEKQTGQAPEFFFNGVIDEVKVFNRTLSQQEIQTSMIAEFPSFLVVPLFMMATILAVIVYKKNGLKVAK
jgi:hypothetical protein